MWYNGINNPEFTCSKPDRVDLNLQFKHPHDENFHQL